MYTIILHALLISALVCVSSSNSGLEKNGRGGYPLDSREEPFLSQLAGALFHFTGSSMFRGGGLTSLPESESAPSGAAASRSEIAVVESIDGDSFRWPGSSKQSALLLKRDVAHRSAVNDDMVLVRCNLETGDVFYGSSDGDDDGGGGGAEGTSVRGSRERTSGPERAHRALASDFFTAGTSDGRATSLSSTPRTPYSSAANAKNSSSYDVSSFASPLQWFGRLSDPWTRRQHAAFRTRSAAAALWEARLRQSERNSPPPASSPDTLQEPCGSWSKLFPAAQATVSPSILGTPPMPCALRSSRQPASRKTAGSPGGGGGGDAPDTAAALEAEEAGEMGLRWPYKNLYPMPSVVQVGPAAQRFLGPAHFDAQYFLRAGSVTSSAAAAAAGTTTSRVTSETAMVAELIKVVNASVKKAAAAAPAGTCTTGLGDGGGADDAEVVRMLGSDAYRPLGNIAPIPPADVPAWTWLGIPAHDALSSYEYSLRQSEASEARRRRSRRATSAARSTISDENDDADASLQPWLSPLFTFYLSGTSVGALSLPEREFVRRAAGRACSSLRRNFVRQQWESISQYGGKLADGGAAVDTSQLLRAAAGQQSSNSPKNTGARRAEAEKEGGREGRRRAALDSAADSAPDRASDLPTSPFSLVATSSFLTTMLDPTSKQEQASFASDLLKDPIDVLPSVQSIKESVGVGSASESGGGSGKSLKLGGSSGSSSRGLETRASSVSAGVVRLDGRGDRSISLAGGSPEESKGSTASSASRADAIYDVREQRRRRSKNEYAWPSDQRLIDLLSVNETLAASAASCSDQHASSAIRDSSSNYSPSAYIPQAIVSSLILHVSSSDGLSLRPSSPWLKNLGDVLKAEAAGRKLGVGSSPTSPPPSSQCSGLFDESADEECVPSPPPSAAALLEAKMVADQFGGALSELVGYDLRPNISQIDMVRAARAYAGRPIPHAAQNERFLLKIERTDEEESGAAPSPSPPGTCSDARRIPYSASAEAETIWGALGALKTFVGLVDDWGIKSAQAPGADIAAVSAAFQRDCLQQQHQQQGSAHSPFSTKLPSASLPEEQQQRICESLWDFMGRGMGAEEEGQPSSSSGGGEGGFASGDILPNLQSALHALHSLVGGDAIEPLSFFTGQMPPLPPARATAASEGESRGTALEPSSQSAAAAPPPPSLLRARRLLYRLLHEPRLPLPIQLPLFIMEAPLKPWRGLSLDTSRHYLPPASLLSQLEAASSARMNVIHWHPVDSQSWSLDLQATPSLARAASWSYPAQTYTPSDILSFIRTAADRGVRVVIEVDAPAHARGLGLGSPVGALVQCTRTAGDSLHSYDKYALNPSHNASYGIYAAVLAELSLLAPDAYLHIGGDEVSAECWGEDAALTAWARKNLQSLVKAADDSGWAGRGSKSSEYVALLSHWMHRVGGIVKLVGKTGAAWEDSYDIVGRADKERSKSTSSGPSHLDHNGRPSSSSSSSSGSSPPGPPHVINPAEYRPSFNASTTLLMSWAFPSEMPLQGWKCWGDSNALTVGAESWWPQSGGSGGIYAASLASDVLRALDKGGVHKDAPIRAALLSSPLPWLARNGEQEQQQALAPPATLWDATLFPTAYLPSTKEAAAAQQRPWSEASIGHHRPILNSKCDYLDSSDPWQKFSVFSWPMGGEPAYVDALKRFILEGAGPSGEPPSTRSSRRLASKGETASSLRKTAHQQQQQQRHRHPQPSPLNSSKTQGETSHARMAATSIDEGEAHSACISRASLIRAGSLGLPYVVSARLPLAGGETAIWTERIDASNSACRAWPRAASAAETLASSSAAYARYAAASRSVGWTPESHINHHDSSSSDAWSRGVYDGHAHRSWIAFTAPRLFLFSRRLLGLGIAPASAPLAIFENTLAAPQTTPMTLPFWPPLANGASLPLPPSPQPHSVDKLQFDWMRAASFLPFAAVPSSLKQWIVPPFLSYASLNIEEEVYAYNGLCPGIEPLVQRDYFGRQNQEAGMHGAPDGYRGPSSASPHAGGASKAHGSSTAASTSPIISHSPDRLLRLLVWNIDNGGSGGGGGGATIASCKSFEIPIFPLMWWFSLKQMAGHGRPLEIWKRWRRRRQPRRRVYAPPILLQTVAVTAAIAAPPPSAQLLAFSNQGTEEEGRGCRLSLLSPPPGAFGLPHRRNEHLPPVPRL